MYYKLSLLLFVALSCNANSVTDCLSNPVDCAKKIFTSSETKTENDPQSGSGSFQQQPTSFWTTSNILKYIVAPGAAVLVAGAAIGAFLYVRHRRAQAALALGGGEDPTSPLLSPSPDTAIH